MIWRKKKPVFSAYLVLTILLTQNVHIFPQETKDPSTTKAEKSSSLKKAFKFLLFAGATTLSCLLLTNCKAITKHDLDNYETLFEEFADFLLNDNHVQEDFIQWQPILTASGLTQKNLEDMRNQISTNFELFVGLSLLPKIKSPIVNLPYYNEKTAQLLELRKGNYLKEQAHIMFLAIYFLKSSLSPKLFFNIAEKYKDCDEKIVKGIIPVEDTIFKNDESGQRFEFILTKNFELMDQRTKCQLYLNKSPEFCVLKQDRVISAAENYRYYLVNKKLLYIIDKKEAANNKYVSTPENDRYFDFKTQVIVWSAKYCHNKSTKWKTDKKLARSSTAAFSPFTTERSFCQHLLFHQLFYKE